LTYREIAEELDASTSGVYGAIKRVLKRAKAETQETADLLRQQESERLDRARAKLWPRVAEGDPAAVEAWRRLSESYRNLWGLDLAPGITAQAPPPSPPSFVIVERPALTPGGDEAGPA
jgi:hypothetical protein